MAAALRDEGDQPRRAGRHALVLGGLTLGALVLSGLAAKGPLSSRVDLHELSPSSSPPLGPSSPTLALSTPGSAALPRPSLPRDQRDPAVREALRLGQFAPAFELLSDDADESALRLRYELLAAQCDANSSTPTPEWVALQARAAAIAAPLASLGSSPADTTAIALLTLACGPPLEPLPPELAATLQLRLRPLLAAVTPVFPFWRELCELQARVALDRLRGAAPAEQQVPVRQLHEALTQFAQRGGEPWEVALFRAEARHVLALAPSEAGAKPRGLAQAESYDLALDALDALDALLLNLSRTHPFVQAHSYLLRATLPAALATNPGQARVLLEAARAKGTSATRASASLALARLHLREGRPQEALDVLDGLEGFERVEQLNRSTGLKSSIALGWAALLQGEAALELGKLAACEAFLGRLNGNKLQDPDLRIRLALTAREHRARSPGSKSEASPPAAVISGLSERAELLQVRTLAFEGATEAASAQLRAAAAQGRWALLTRAHEALTPPAQTLPAVAAVRRTCAEELARGGDEALEALLNANLWREGLYLGRVLAGPEDPARWSRYLFRALAQARSDLGETEFRALQAAARAELRAAVRARSDLEPAPGPLAYVSFLDVFDFPRRGSFELLRLNALERSLKAALAISGRDHDLHHAMCLMRASAVESEPNGSAQRVRTLRYLATALRDWVAVGPHPAQDLLLSRSQVGEARRETLAKIARQPDPDRYAVSARISLTSEAASLEADLAALLATCRRSSRELSLTRGQRVALAEGLATIYERSGEPGRGVAALQRSLLECGDAKTRATALVASGRIKLRAGARASAALSAEAALSLAPPRGARCAASLLLAEASQDPARAVQAWRDAEASAEVEQDWLALAAGAPTASDRARCVLASLRGARLSSEEVVKRIASLREPELPLGLLLWEALRRLEAEGEARTGHFLLTQLTQGGGEGLALLAAAAYLAALREEAATGQAIDFQMTLRSRPATWADLEGPSAELAEALRAARGALFSRAATPNSLLPLRDRLREAIREAPREVVDRLQAWLELAELELGCGRAGVPAEVAAAQARALEIFERVFQQPETRPQVRAHYGALLSQLGRLEEALSVMSSADARETPLRTALRRSVQARLLEHLGDFRGAAESAREALAEGLLSKEVTLAGLLLVARCATNGREPEWARGALADLRAFESDQPPAGRLETWGESSLRWGLDGEVADTRLALGEVKRLVASQPRAGEEGWIRIAEASVLIAEGSKSTGIQVLEQLRAGERKDSFARRRAIELLHLLGAGN